MTDQQPIQTHPPARSGWRSTLADILGIIGVSILAIGCWMIYTPLAWIVLGLAIFVGGVALARRP